MAHRLVLVAGGRSAEAPDTLKSARLLMETAQVCGHPVRLIELGTDADARRRLFDQIAEDEIVYPLVSGLEGALHFFGYPYVGAHPTLAGVAADKVLFNDYVVRLGLGKVPYVWGAAEDLPAKVDAAGLTGPLYVKPARLGASKGMTRVDDRLLLADAVKTAAEHDPKVLVEESVPTPFFEAEVAGVAGSEVWLSTPCQVDVADGFSWRDYDAKMALETSLTPMDESDIRDEIEQTTRKIIAALGYLGPFRLDLFVGGPGKVYVGEINALPGQSTISTFPRMFAACGVTKEQQLERLIEAALTLHHSLSGDRSRY